MAQISIYLRGCARTFRIVFKTFSILREEVFFWIHKFMIKYVTVPRKGKIQKQIFLQRGVAKKKQGRTCKGKKRRIGPPIVCLMEVWGFVPAKQYLMVFKVHKNKHLILKKQHTCSVWAPEWDRLHSHLQSVSYLDSRNKANINKMSILTYKSQGTLNVRGRSARSYFLKVSPSSVLGQLGVITDGVIISTLER